MADAVVASRTERPLTKGGNYYGSVFLSIGFSYTNNPQCTCAFYVLLSFLRPLASSPPQYNHITKQVHKYLLPIIAFRSLLFAIQDRFSRPGKRTLKAFKVA